MSSLPLYTVALTGFSNPKYFAADTADAKGFDITGAASYNVSFGGSGVSTVVHEQTNDPTGASGWFQVAGKPTNSVTGTAATGGSTSGTSYLFAAIGCRARIRVTALTTADATAQVNLNEKAMDVGAAQVAVGPSAHDAAVSGNPIRTAGRARTSNVTGVASDDTVDLVATTIGAQVVKPHSIPELEWSYAAAAGGIVNTTTAVTIKAAAGAGVRNYLTGLQIGHAALGGATELVIRDGASGTVMFRLQLQTAAKEDIQIEFPNPIKGTANTLMEVALLTAVTGGVYVNAQGFAAP